MLLKMMEHRFNSLVSGKAAFLLQTDLAAFHGPFFTDADAVHWVSLLDLQLWARQQGMAIKKLGTGGARLGSKNWVVKRLLTCAVEIHGVTG
jgi:hypothetical protein